MCGRFARGAEIASIQATFAVDVVKAELAPSYNIAPTQEVLAVVQSAKGTRGLVALKWGLIPAWAKDASGAAKLINARSESVHEKPSFRESFRHQRCLIPASGFYEWRTEQGQKQPVYIQARDQELLAFAGLYAFWQNPEGQKIATCTILTTSANAAISQIHARMPVILKPEQQALWLDKAQRDPAALQALLTPYVAEQTRWHRVSSQVNKVSYNQPEALQAVAD